MNTKSGKKSFCLTAILCLIPILGCCRDAAPVKKTSPLNLISEVASEIEVYTKVARERFALEILTVPMDMTADLLQDDSRTVLFNVIAAGRRRMTVAQRIEDEVKKTSPASFGQPKLRFGKSEFGLNQTDKTVDEILSKISKFGTAPKEIEKLQILGADAVPRLLYHLNRKFTTKKQTFSSAGSHLEINLGTTTKEVNPERIFALSMLQYVWSDEAFLPVSDILKNDEDNQARYLAMVILSKHEKEKIVDLLPSLIEDSNSKIAGFAFTNLENRDPNVIRMMNMLERVELWGTLYSYLPRYYSPVLTEGTLKMLEGGEDKFRIAAIESLIQQNADFKEARDLVVECLKSKNPSVREAAAEYLTWHGTSDDIPKLEAALKKEKDIYSKSSLDAAIVSIRRRQEWLLSRQNDKNPYSPPEPSPTIYMKALNYLENEKDAKGLGEALTMYKNAEPFEPLWSYKGENPAAEFMRRCADRLALQVRLFAIPGLLREKEDFVPGKSAEIPAVQQLITPVRKFFDEKRKSFGLYIGSEGGPFAGSIHVGDDVEFDSNHTTVIAIGDGIARAAEVSYSWGGLVVIEHRSSGRDRFYSVYAHLSPFIHVKAGEIVRKGQKIACLGRSYTWENGGYKEHLHFGICTGNYRREQLAGYLSPELFKNGRHGWVDPQSFIRQRM